MSKRRHAFDKRKDWTCSICWYCTIKNGRPYCTQNEDYNRWNIFEFGCGEYAITNSGGVEIPVTLDCYGGRA